MSNVKSLLLTILPLMAEIIISSIYVWSLVIFNVGLYGKTIMIGSASILLLLLLRYKKSKRFNNMRGRIVLQATLNIFLFSLLGYSLFNSSSSSSIYIIIWTIAINGLLEMDFIFYLFLCRHFSPSISNKLSVSAFIALGIFSSFLNLITKDNWVFVGIVGAYLNHILDPKSLLRLQKKSEEDIKDIIVSNKLNNIFWLIKGAGLSLMTSWAFTIFILGEVVKINGQTLDRTPWIFLFTYLAFTIILICVGLFKMITDSLNWGKNSKDSDNKRSKLVKLNKYTEYEFIKCHSATDKN